MSEDENALSRRRHKRMAARHQGFALLLAWARHETRDRELEQLTDLLDYEALARMDQGNE